REESRHQRLRGGAVPLVDVRGVARFVPRVPRLFPARLRPRPMLDRLVGQDAEGRDDVFLEVLVLIVAPDQDDVWRELIESLARFPETFDQGLAVTPRCAEALVGAVLLGHRRGPAGGLPVLLGESRILEDALEDARHVFIAATERGIVRHAETQDRTHDSPSSARLGRSPRTLVQMVPSRSMDVRAAGRRGAGAPPAEGRLWQGGSP